MVASIFKIDKTITICDIYEKVYTKYIHMFEEIDWSIYDAICVKVSSEMTSWLLLVIFIVFMLLSHVVSWVRCDCIVS